MIIRFDRKFACVNVCVLLRAVFHFSLCLRRKRNPSTRDINKTKKQCARQSLRNDPGVWSSEWNDWIQIMIQPANHPLKERRKSFCELHFDCDGFGNLLVAATSSKQCIIRKQQQYRPQQKQEWQNRLMQNKRSKTLKECVCLLCKYEWRRALISTHFSSSSLSLLLHPFTEIQRKHTRKYAYTNTLNARVRERALRPRSSAKKRKENKWVNTRKIKNFAYADTKCNSLGSHTVHHTVSLCRLHVIVYDYLQDNQRMNEWILNEFAITEIIKRMNSTNATVQSSHTHNMQWATDKSTNNFVVRMCANLFLSLLTIFQIP